jgi:choline dehydrogenase-like flavoprotein
VSSTEAAGGNYDVVVVGGGIAGAALAAKLASAGRGVLVLEAQDTYRESTKATTRYVVSGGSDSRTVITGRRGRSLGQ